MMEAPNALDPALLKRLLDACGGFQLDEPAGPPEREIPLVSRSCDAKPLPLRKFLGGGLREGACAFVWKDAKALNFVSVMQDSDPYSDAKGGKDQTWLKGDVMEVFIQPPGGKAYYELHVAPSGATLELAIPSVELFRDGSIKDKDNSFDSGASFDFSCLSNGVFKGWASLISIPFGGFLGPSAEGARFAVCRYNYNRPWGPEPELSSTASFPSEIPSYHNPERWHSLRLP